MTPEIWDPQTEVWSTVPDIAVPRMYHSNALLLPSGQVLNAGGGRAPAGPTTRAPSSTTPTTWPSRTPPSSPGSRTSCGHLAARPV
jgi:hypothetical protein